MKPRLLRIADISAAVQLSTEAGWNQTEEDWRLLIELSPDACFAIEIDGELACTATVITYGSQLGWIGMVLTRKQFQRRGCARILLEHATAKADAKGIATLKLDATEMGAPLYATLGFREEQAAERWFRDTSSTGSATASSDGGPIPTAIDVRAFGADRSVLLHRLAVRGSLATLPGAYAFSRPGRLARYLGPCVAADRIGAQHVIERELQHGGACFWDLLPGNSEAVELARKFGFAPVRRLKRMGRGRELGSRTEHVFALAGFELG